MTRLTAATITKRGVYAFEHDDQILYVGSSSCNLTNLEFNHRNAWKKGWSMTDFREALAGPYKGVGLFKWLVQPYPCNQKTIETDEGILIRKHDPLLNKDYNPVATSIWRGRYT